MKVDYQKVADCRGKLIVTADATETRPDYDSIVKEYVTHARVPGFRPGKAPLEIIKRRFERELDEDVRRKLISNFYRQAVEQQNLDVASLVDIGDVIFSPQTGISFVATVDLAPTFKLPKYQKIAIKEMPIVVEEAQIEQELSNLRRSFTRFEPGDNPVATGDAVKIDFVALHKNRPLQEVVEGSGSYASASDHWAFATKPEMIPGLADALLGRKAGESAEFTAKFPKDFAFEGLRGLEADYSLTVKEVRASVVTADPEIAKTLGMESFEELRSKIHERLEQQATSREEQRQQQEVIDFLLKKCDFALPQSVVALESQLVLRQMLSDISQHQDATGYLAEHREEILKKATETATTRLRLNYILKAIAIAEDIEVLSDELNQHIVAAVNYALNQGTDKGMNYEKMLQRFSENGSIERIEGELLNRKVLDWLLKDAKA